MPRKELRHATKEAQTKCSPRKELRNAHQEKEKTHKKSSDMPI
jgi:hypothetical protein